MEMDGNSMERHNMHPYVTKLLPASWIFDDLWLGGGASPFSGTCPHAIVSFDPNRTPSVHRIWQCQAFQSTGFGPPRKQREMGKSTRNLNKPSITAIACKQLLRVAGSFSRCIHQCFQGRETSADPGLTGVCCGTITSLVVHLSFGKTACPRISTWHSARMPPPLYRP